MRNHLLAALISLLAISGCGGGSGGGGVDNRTGLNIPVGTVSGTSFDGLLVGGTVKVYDYTTGSKGAELAQAMTDSKGLYSLSLQIESRPLLIELTGGSYIEEAGANHKVTLTSQKLSAVSNYTAGANLKVAVTSYSHMASGLAVYQVSKGIAVATAIDNANLRVSTLAGVNILATAPKAINDAASASATLTPELSYGFLAGAISMWTYTHAPTVADAHQTTYTSIDFSQLLYQDISADGLLDGKGVDSTGSVTSLSYGTVPLTTEAFRLGLAVALLQMVNDKNNKTSLDGAALLQFAKAYAASTDAIFNSVPPTSIAPPVVVVTSPGTGNVLNHTVGVTASAQAVAGILSVDLLVDNKFIAAAANPASPSVQFDTASLVDGPHTFAMRAKDLGGQTTTSSVSVTFNNVSPTITITAPAANTLVSGTITVSATTASVAGLSKVELLVGSVLVANAASLATPSFQLNTANYADGSQAIGIRTTDVGGQVVMSTVQVTFVNTSPIVTLTSPANNTWARKFITLSGTVSSAGTISSVEYIADGLIVGPFVDKSAPSMQLDTTAYSDGAHVVGIRATDSLNHVTTTTATIKIDNTPPVMTGVVVGASFPQSVSGNATDNYSGVTTITEIYPFASGSVASPAANGTYTAYGNTFRITDTAGNCSDYALPNTTFNGTYWLSSAGTGASLSLTVANSCP